MNSSMTSKLMKKHITQSEGVVKSLAQSTDEMMSTFHDEKRKIMVQSETTHRDIAEASEDDRPRGNGKGIY
jgi:hypothetical protein